MNYDKICKMPLYKTKAININSSVKLGEADKLVTILSPEYGKIKIIAKGARRPGSKFGGRLELFAYNQYLLASGRNFDILSQIETISNFNRIRESLPVLQAGLYILKLIDSFTEEKIASPKLFELLLHCLYLLDGGVEPKIVIKIFEVKLAEVEGVYPNLTECVHCRKKLKTKPEKIRFSAESGGIVCSQCRQQNPSAFDMPFEIISLMEKLRLIKLSDYKLMISEKVKYAIEDKKISALNEFITAYLARHLNIDIGKLKKYGL